VNDEERVVLVAKPAPTKSVGAGLATKQPYEALVCRLMVATPVVHVIKWITTLLPTPKGWKAELAWLVNHSRHFTHEMVTYTDG